MNFFLPKMENQLIIKKILFNYYNLNILYVFDLNQSYLLVTLFKTSSFEEKED